MIRSCLVLLLILSLGAPLTPQAAGQDLEPIAKPRYQLRSITPETVVEIGRGGGFDVQLVLDDGTIEGASGVNGAQAGQFLWLSSFDSPGAAFELEEIEVVFPAGSNMTTGAAVQLVIYSDNDPDPSNGAILLQAVDETIQAVDGTTPSSYSLAQPIPFAAGERPLIGVVPRFIETGVTSPTFPAAVDTTDSQGASWIALWIGDPPTEPSLPSDDVTVPVSGNWIIRGFGTLSPTAPGIPEVPALDWRGLAGLILLLAGLGVARVRRS